MEWPNVLGVVVGNAAITVPLFFWLRSEANSDRRDIINLIVAIKDEMKDFHGRLERQDAEFKGHVLLMEERNKK